MRNKTLVFMTVLALVTLSAAQTKNDNAKASAAAVKQAKEAKAKPVKITKGPIIEEVTDNAAIIAWSTNEHASSVVHYGTQDEKTSQTAEVPYGGPTHRVHLKNLKPGTKYFFVVDSGQGAGSGTEAKSPEMSFTTPAKGQKPEKYPKAGPGM